MQAKKTSIQGASTNLLRLIRPPQFNNLPHYEHNNIYGGDFWNILKFRWDSYLRCAVGRVPLSDQMAGLQRIQNNSARLIFRKKRSEHVTPSLISHHWLPIEQRIEYKLAAWLSATLMVHFPLTSQTVSFYTPRRSVRSSSDVLFSVPRVNLKSAGARSFQYQVPCVKNSVPIQIRLSPSLTSFKCSLKTHLFRTAFT